MKRFKPSTLVALITGGTLAILLIVVGGGTAKCVGQKIRSVPSPSGQRTAAIYWIECKPENFRQLELHLIDANSDVSTTLGPSTNSDIELAWVDDSRLIVSVPTELSEVSNLRFQGVEVSFRHR
jgi:hypothetical protein